MVIFHSYVSLPEGNGNVNGMEYSWHVDCILMGKWWSTMGWNVHGIWVEYWEIPELNGGFNWLGNHRTKSAIFQQATFD